MDRYENTKWRNHDKWDSDYNTLKQMAACQQALKVLSENTSEHTINVQERLPVLSIKLWNNPAMCDKCGSPAKFFSDDCFWCYQCKER